MKSKFAALGISIIILSLANTAFAQTATISGTSRKEIKRENIQTRVDDLKVNIATREANLKARLAKFKDKLKAERITRINTNLSMINTHRTATANRFLANATRILDKLQERVTKEVGKGKDGTAANLAITDARSKIASASAAVASQSAMDYTVSISSESAAKVEVKQTRDKLHDDWQNIRQLVIGAKQAVAHAIEVAVTTLAGGNP